MHSTFQRVKTIELENRFNNQDKHFGQSSYGFAFQKEMDRFTFSDTKVQSRLKDVVLLEIDVTDGTPDDMDLLKRFKLFGPPGILFMDRQGNDIPNIKVIGFLNKNDFLTVLNAVLL
jgi:thiol:disulfide interchange protein DsbD